MAARIQRAFFKAEEVIFIGYSKRNEAFCRTVKAAFEKSGATVYPVNPNGGPEGVKVYRSVDEIPSRPSFAYVLTNASRSADLVSGLAERGVRRILFNSRMSVSQETLDRCAELGIETAVACPMMALGGGFHRFHGFLAGVRS